MSSNRVWVWSGRLAALVAAVVIPACGSTGSPGGSNPNGILWNSQGNTNAATGQPVQYWYDPNTGVVSPIGIQNIVTSVDDATYDSFTLNSVAGQLSGGRVTYIAGLFAPLSTDTGSVSITNRENALQGDINGYRQSQLGNVGGGGINGGVAVGNVTGIILSGHFKATKSARGHCKYYGLNYGAGNFAAVANQQGDDMQTTTGQTNPFGTPAPGNPDGDQGRLGKIGVIAFVPSFAQADFCFAGPQYGEHDLAFQHLLRTSPGAIAATGPTNFAVGHWRQGPETYYWDIIYLLNPTPPN